MFLLKIVLSVSIDCPSIIDFSRSIEHKANATFMDEIELDCCNSVYITCRNSRVTEVHMRYMGLKGIIDFKSLKTLDYLKSVDLSYNQLQGSIDAIPLGLEYLELNHNTLSGKIPQFPLYMRVMDLSFNRFSDFHDFSANDHLSSIDLSHNELNTTFPVLPRALMSLNLAYNQFHGSMPSLPQSMTSVLVNNNLLSGCLSYISYSLNALDISNNNYLKGSIVLGTPKWLKLVKILFINLK